MDEGGIIVLDDFGHWEGCREAFYDFRQRQGIRPILERFENEQAFGLREGFTIGADGYIILNNLCIRLQKYDRKIRS